MAHCAHLDHVHHVARKPMACEDCVPLGDTWVHLRQCMECGHVACCDSSKNTHATKHFHRSKHPIMRSVERGEDWGWCYVDESMLSFADPAHPVVASDQD